jgi:MFS family permease
LTEGLNPAWAGAVGNLASQAVTPLLGAGKTSLSESDWAALQAKLAPYAAWLSSKPGTGVEKLGVARVRELLSGDAKARIEELIAQDAALAPEYAQIVAVEQLVRFQRDLVKLLTNYVSFAEFYGRRGAVFQSGSLYLDARTCHLCVDVVDAGRHATLAGLAGIYLAYCDCSRPGMPKRTIVAAFTNGDSDNLMVGRNGVFYDRKGQDWDATIVKVVANPISLREAFWSPYKKLLRMIEELVAKRAAAADAAADKKLASAATAATTADKAKPAEPKKIDVGTVAALGVAVGAIGAAIAGLATGVMNLSWWQIPLVFVGIILLISLPSMVIAWLKLRRRNLGPLLDANGWAINTRARINTPFGAALTQLPQMPENSQRSLDDPFAEKGRPWGLYVFILLLAAAAVWVRVDRKQRGHYFWRKPAVEATTNAVPAEVPAVVPTNAPAQ